jgi:hypothetical protein
LIASFTKVFVLPSMSCTVQESFARRPAFR